MADCLCSSSLWTNLPSLKKPLTCGAFINLLDGAIKGQIVSFILPIAAVLTWSDSSCRSIEADF